MNHPRKHPHPQTEDSHIWHEAILPAPVMLGIPLPEVPHSRELHLEPRPTTNSFSRPSPSHRSQCHAYSWRNRVRRGVASLPPPRRTRKFTHPGAQPDETHITRFLPLPHSPASLAIAHVVTGTTRTCKRTATALPLASSPSTTRSSGCTKTRSLPSWRFRITATRMTAPSSC